MIQLEKMTSFPESREADVVVFDPKTKLTLAQKKLHVNVDDTP